MPVEDMRLLVSEHARELRFVFEQRQQTRVDVDRAIRQSERIGNRIAQHMKLPNDMFRVRTRRLQIISECRDVFSERRIGVDHSLFVHVFVEFVRLFEQIEIHVSELESRRWWKRGWLLSGCAFDAHEKHGQNEGGPVEMRTSPAFQERSHAMRLSEAASAVNCEAAFKALAAEIHWRQPPARCEAANRNEIFRRRATFQALCAPEHQIRRASSLP